MQVQDADLKLLRVFDTVVRCGGYAAAQSALNLGGSRISEYMSQLETRMGVRLCERGRAGFRLTEDGAHLHEAAQRLLGAVDTFSLESGALSKQLRGALRFGVIEATLTDDQSPLLPAIRSFVRVAPDVHLQIVMDTPAGMEQRVLDGSLHLALGPFPDRVAGLDYKTLYREEQLLYCASPHPVYSCPPGPRQLEEISRSKLAARTYLGGQELTLLQIAEAAASVDNVEGRALLILSGNYLGFLPAHYAHPWEQSGLLKRINPHRLRTHLEFKAIRRHSPQPARAVQGFLDHLVSASQQRKRTAGKL
ncbi:HTH-type transcriptional regulator YofA (plasmid) [Variovorax sp. SRS16]|uniref:LysR family transcriptional regulator n=1 Tax=Variovorax sp. SRS16 TaxID=282217 RepID=UPI001318E9CB|nr:LysR family transcriptional regulator [Variovorax sp. SRS16]VTU46462.1 HTH-type transcriptional regulator YofA [Variovorax sp. SRS16]